MINIQIKRSLFFGVIILAAVFLSACSKISADQTSGGNGQTFLSELQSPLIKEITYTDDGFSPTELKVKVGDNVQFKNASNKTIEIGAGPHPGHDQFSELNLGLFSPGEVKTVSSTKAGIEKFHNHLNESEAGKIVVER